MASAQVDIGCLWARGTACALILIGYGSESNVYQHSLIIQFLHLDLGRILGKIQQRDEKFHEKVML